jgi:hypothetical protein
LTYDFVGQSGEENEALSIAVPMSWRADFNNPVMVRSPLDIHMYIYV